MKKKLFLLTLFSFLLLKGQNRHIKGQILDQNDLTPLAFAHIYIHNHEGSITNEQGIFEIDLSNNNKFFKVSYTGYETQKIFLSDSLKFYRILLKPNNERLKEVRIHAKGINPALLIIKKAIQRKKSNDFRNSINQISFLNYYNFKLTANRDSLDCNLDTLGIYKNGKKRIFIDSTMFKFCKDLDERELYMIENITENKIINKQQYRKVLALRTAGFKNPVYEILQLQFSKKNPYDDYYQILYKEYLGPLNKKSLKAYRYKILDTLKQQNRIIYKIGFTKKDKPLIKGELFIDSESYALSGLKIQATNQLIIDTEFSFKYLPEPKMWIPILQKTSLRGAKDFKYLEFGKLKLTVEIGKGTSDSITHTNPQKVINRMYVKIKDSMMQFKFQQKKGKKPLYSIEVTPKATQRNEEYWYNYTGKHLNEREKNTYKNMDSLFQMEHIEEKIDKYKKLIYGKLPLGKMDLNLVRLLSINRYEGARLEINLESNTYLSKKWKWDAYLAYGLKDKDFKYHTGVAYQFSHTYDSYIQLSYTKDLEKSAIFTSLKNEDFFAHIWNTYPWEKFTSFHEIAIKFSSLLTQNLNTQMKVSRGYYKRKFDLPYHPGRIEFPEYDLSKLDLSFRWEPHSQYFKTNEGGKKMKNGFPKYFLLIQTNLPSLQKDKSYFLRSEIQSLFRKKYLNKDFTDLKLQIGMNFGQVRIQQMFQPDFNDFYAQDLWKHITMSKNNAFETVKDFEFLSNYIATAYLSHHINHIKIRKDKSIDLLLSGGAAYGFAWDKNRYLGSKDLRKGLFETGIEIKRVFKGFGFGFHYRLGAYSTGSFTKDISIRFNFTTFNLLK